MILELYEYNQIQYEFVSRIHAAIGSLGQHLISHLKLNTVLDFPHLLFLDSQIFLYFPLYPSLTL